MQFKKVKTLKKLNMLKLKLEQNDSDASVFESSVKILYYS